MISSKKNLYTNNVTPTNLWDVAISDAEKLLNEAKERVAGLKRSITIFREKRDSGEPFPSEKRERSEAQT